MRAVAAEFTAPPPTATQWPIVLLGAGKLSALRLYFTKKKSDAVFG